MLALLYASKKSHSENLCLKTNLNLVYKCKLENKTFLDAPFAYELVHKYYKHLTPSSNEQIIALIIVFLI